jgi:ankyrin repeat protein
MKSSIPVLVLTWLLVLQSSPELRAQAPAISPDRAKARRELGLLSIQYSKDSFVKQASEGDTIAVQLFITAGMDPNAVSATESGTALIAASRAGYPETVQALVAAGANVNAQVRGSTALIVATRLDIIKSLLDHGADVNAKGSGGFTPLMNATLASHSERIKLLISRGADVNARDDSGKTALMSSVERAAKAESDANTYPTERSRQAMRVDVVKVLLASKADVHAKDNEGRTALLLAAQHGGSDMIRYLLDQGANVNDKSNDGWTVLMAAVNAGNPHAVKALLEKGADVNARTTRFTVLSVALQGRKPDIIQLVTTAGAKQ